MKYYKILNESYYSLIEKASTNIQFELDRPDFEIMYGVLSSEKKRKSYDAIREHFLSKEGKRESLSQLLEAGTLQHGLPFERFPPLKYRPINIGETDFALLEGHSEILKSYESHHPDNSLDYLDRYFPTMYDLNDEIRIGDYEFIYTDMELFVFFPSFNLYFKIFRDTNGDLVPSILHAYTYFKQTRERSPFQTYMKEYTSPPVKDTGKLRPVTMTTKRFSENVEKLLSSDFYFEKLDKDMGATSLRDFMGRLEAGLTASASCEDNLL